MMDHLAKDPNVDLIVATRKPDLHRDLNRYAQLVELDIGDTETIFTKKEVGKPDVLLHLAWGGLPNYKSLHHIEHELVSQYKFLSDLVRDGLSNIVAMGSCFEYGMLDGCLNEDMLTRPDNPYGYAKDCLRKQLQFLQKEVEFNLTWMRLFYVFGRGQPESTLYSQLYSAVSRKDRVFNMSGGEQIRDYLSIEEVIRIVTKLVMRDQNHGIVNVCSGQPISIRKLVESWIEKNNWSIELNLGYYNYPDYEPFSFWGDASKLMSLIE